MVSGHGCSFVQLAVCWVPYLSLYKATILYLKIIA